MAEVGQHFCHATLASLLARENGRVTTAVEARGRLKRLALDVHRVWLSNIDHLRKHKTFDTGSRPGTGLDGRRDVDAIDGGSSQLQSVSAGRAMASAYFESPDAATSRQVDLHGADAKVGVHAHLTVDPPPPPPAALEAVVDGAHVDVARHAADGGGTVSRRVWVHRIERVDAPAGDPLGERALGTWWRVEAYDVEAAKGKAVVFSDAAVRAAAGAEGAGGSAALAAALLPRLVEHGARLRLRDPSAGPDADDPFVADAGDAARRSAGLWEDEALDELPMSILVCGRGDRASGALGVCPGTAAVGRLGLWWRRPFGGPPERTQAAGMFFRDVAWSSSDAVLVCLCLAVETTVLAPKLTAFELEHHAPKRPPHEPCSHPTRLPRHVSAGPSAYRPPQSPLDARLAPPVYALQNAAVELDWKWTEEAQRQRPLHEVLGLPRPGVAGEPYHRRGSPAVDAATGFRRAACVELMRPDPATTTYVFGITRASVTAPVTKVEGRSTWHSEQRAVEQLCRTRLPADFASVTVSDTHHGINEANCYRCVCRAMCGILVLSLRLLLATTHATLLPTYYYYELTHSLTHLLFLAAVQHRAPRARAVRPRARDPLQLREGLRAHRGRARGGDEDPRARGEDHEHQDRHRQRGQPGGLFPRAAAPQGR